MLTTNQDVKPAQELTWDQRLLRNSGRNKTVLRPEYQELKFTLHRKLLDKINLEALATIDNQRVRGEVRQAVISLIDGEPTLLSSIERQQISEEVLDEVFGLGPLEPLLQDPTISDILVNGYKQVFVERKGLLEPTNVCFRDNGHLLRIIDKIVSQVGRRVDESNPMVDARLSDGSRVNAIVPPLAVDGPLLSIRRFGTDKLMPADLVEKKALMPGMVVAVAATARFDANPSTKILIVVASFAAGFFGPNEYVRRTAARRQKRIRRGLPNALDLMVVCVESGLGLDQAIVHVAKELHLRIPRSAENSVS